MAERNITFKEAFLSFSRLGVGNSFGSNPLLWVREEQANNTHGGDAAAATWNIRTLNTVVINQITGAELTSNRFTLPVGTYWLEARAPARAVDAHKLKILNATDTVDEIIGQDAHTASSVSVTVPALLSGMLIITDTSKTFELQHYTTTAAATSGLGVATNASVIEVYAEVMIWQLKVGE